MSILSEIKALFLDLANKITWIVLRKLFVKRKLLKNALLKINKWAELNKDKCNFNKRSNILLTKIWHQWMSLCFNCGKL